MKRTKYGSKKVKKDGIWFDSIYEMKRYCVLKLLAKSGRISDLRLQVPYLVSPAIYFNSDIKSFTFEKQSGKHGFCVQREKHYIADFVYREKGVEVVEDAKGFRTDEYKKKANQMRKLYGIIIKET